MVFYASVSTLYRQQAGVSIFQISVIESVSLAVSMALEVPWGILADRIGHRKTMVWCSFLFFLSKIVFWKAEGFGGFLLERILLAVTLAGLSGVDESILYASCGEDQYQKVYGHTQALGTLGMIFASMVCSLFIGNNYRLAGLFTAIAYGIAAVFSLFLSETKLPQKNKCSPFNSFRDSLRQVFRTKGLLGVILCGAFFGEVTHTVTVFLNQLQYIRCGWGNSIISLAYILGTLAELSSACSERLTRRIGEKHSGILLLMVSASACVIMIFSLNGWISLGCILAMGFSSALFTPLLSALENRLITIDDRATALSVSSLLTDSIAMLISLLMGRAAEHSLPFAMAVGAGTTLIALVLYACAQPGGAKTYRRASET